MKVLILGGTGTMGNHLTNILAEKGEQIVVTSRSNREEKENIKYRQGNAKDIDFLRNILQEEWDVIVDFMIYSEDEFCERVELLLNSTTHYIFLSSARVYCDSSKAITERMTRLLDSSTDKYFLSTSEYSLLKARQENVLRSLNQRNWTIVRPYITYGEERFQLGNLEKENWLYRALKGRSIVFSKDILNHLTTLTYSMDVAVVIERLLGNPKFFGEEYNIVSDYSCSWSDVLNLYLDILEEKFGIRPNVIYQELNDFIKWNPGRYQIIYDRLYDRVFDNYKISHIVNTQDFVELEEGLRKSMNSFLVNPKFENINWKYEAIKDKLKYLLYRYLIKN